MRELDGLALEIEAGMRRLEETAAEELDRIEALLAQRGESIEKLWRLVESGNSNTYSPAALDALRRAFTGGTRLAGRLRAIRGGLASEAGIAMRRHAVARSFAGPRSGVCGTLDCRG